MTQNSTRSNVWWRTVRLRSWGQVRRPVQLRRPIRPSVQMSRGIIPVYLVGAAVTASVDSGAIIWRIVVTEEHSVVPATGPSVPPGASREHAWDV